MDMEALEVEKRRELIEAVSEVDDQLAEAFLGDEPISPADLQEAIRRATIARKFVPVFMGSVFKNKGVQPLLDGVLNYLPCPIEVSSYALDQTKNEEKVELTGSLDGPLVALAFKLEEGRFGQLTYLRIYEGVIRKGEFIINVNTGKKIKVPRLVRMHSDEIEDFIQIAGHSRGSCRANIDFWNPILVLLTSVKALTKNTIRTRDTFTDGSVKYTMTSMNVPEPVMSLAVQPVSKDSGGQKEDPTFRVGLDPESGQTIISGMGELHLDIYVERIRREYKVDATVGKPHQSGGQGQYGRIRHGDCPRVALCTMINLFYGCFWVTPKCLVNQIASLCPVLSMRRYIEPLRAGSPTKFEFENLLVGQAIPSGFIPAIEKDGTAHAVDSSELAFKLASIYAFIQCYTASRPFILEPVMLVELKVPTEFQGAFAGDINKLRVFKSS
ncbi:hypothetical protein AHAS_Ahas02G0000300 [Arachis hypogaea]